MIMYLFLAVLTFIFLIGLIIYVWLDYAYEYEVLFREPYANGHRTNNDWGKLVKEPIKNDKGKKRKTGKEKKYIQTLLTKRKLPLPDDKYFEIRKRNLFSFWKTKRIEFIKGENDVWIPIKFDVEKSHYESMPVSIYENITNHVNTARAATKIPKKKDIGTLIAQITPIATVAICFMMIFFAFKYSKEIYMSKGGGVPEDWKQFQQTFEDVIGTTNNYRRQAINENETLVNLSKTGE